MSVRVELLAATPNAAKVVAASAKLCYSASDARGLFYGLDEGKCAYFLSMLRKSGHLSPFEHVSFSFAIEGVSRVTTHQLVRHRLASFSQQSQRYVEMKKCACVLPPSVKDIKEAAILFKQQVDTAYECYEKLIAIGIPKEDARFILPHGAETKIIVTMNARELFHFFSLRLCKRAQWEIRGLARRMLVIVREEAPEVFKIAGPSCVTKGKCEEARPCGEPYSGMENLLA